MRNVIFISIALVLLISLNAFAQMEEMMEGGHGVAMEGIHGETMPEYPCPKHMRMGYGEPYCNMSGRHDCGMMGYGPGYGMRGYGMMHGGEGSGMYGRGMMGYGKRWMQDVDEQEYEKFLNETKELRRELHMKKFDLRELSRDPDARIKDIEKIEDEIISLRRKIYRKRPK